MAISYGVGWCNCRRASRSDAITWASTNNSRSEPTSIVASGVAADDWVVVAGGHLLRDGQAVRAVDRRNRPVDAAPR